MRLTVLNVAYPFAPVGIDAIGGAEQVLYAIDRGLVGAGHHSLVIACDGSKIEGTLIPVPRPSGLLTPGKVKNAHRRHQAAMVAALRNWRVDIVHLHGIDFSSYLPPPEIPALATLHLPLDRYSADSLVPRGDLWFNCVSYEQHATCSASPRLLEPIENGVLAEFFSARRLNRRFALLLARICPEKGIHLAIDAAKRAGMPLLIGGEVFPYGEHQRYFKNEIVPRLDRWRRFIGPVRFARKRRLLAAAQCVVIASQVAETSSLVAREALASGTPVVAFPQGALVHLIGHGHTGFLVEDVAEMAAAMVRARELSPEECREAARVRLSLERMIGRYIAVYRRLAGTPRQSRRESAA
jgi:glycosyltransferase involved in cell wall biosynthesis